MIINIHKRQLTFEQRKAIIDTILFYGLVHIGAIVRYIKCSYRTVWRIWARYNVGG